MARERIKVTSIQREFAVMEAMGSHPGIVGYHGCYKTPEKVTFVLELMNGGELFERLVHKGAYTEAEARPAFRRIARALAYLHSRGIVHRDLKVREARPRLPSFARCAARPKCPTRSGNPPRHRPRFLAARELVAQGGLLHLGDQNCRLRALSAGEQLRVAGPASQHAACLVGRRASRVRHRRHPAF